MLAKTSLLAKGNTLELSLKSNDLTKDIELLKCDYIKKCRWTNKDFRDFLKSISLRNSEEERKAFVYCDPPYVFEKGDLESNKDFGIKEMEELLDLLQARKWKFAISCRQESADFWRSKGLYVEQVAKINIGVKSMLNKYEYLAMNYRIQPELF